ncbi:cellulase family glycosylhydrolase [Romboutsia sp. 1001216sp1]|uniref:glycoside hydrolase family 113 n=1 Tax=unclassified Romboutsia TaxID=2626894 RepID=UPI00189F9826|nr:MULTISPECIES: cellulase family glycosylhydrolase [unclassified Romboutsia]MDB8791737.1 cellulase family glycosylhydrolase [Romboutsia sp. 1001216sp1]MDB8802563.1 cellulase family glycosylhydrolase [Romboutsia sp. 1001216sp1]MDB8813960.1 cellulase family glycosylhydrolase [Romboutsia sp. 1001216sp1]
MRKKILIIITSLVILSVIFAIKSTNKNNTITEKIKSVNLSTDYEIEQALKDIDDLKVNTVNVPIVIEIPDLDSNNMKINSYSKEKAIRLIKILKSKGINIILEAYPWIANGSKYETDYNPVNKEKFFEDWKNILNILIKDIANKYDVDIMIIASNFSKLEMYEDNWCDIVNFVKGRFKGEVTYKTTWWYTASWDRKSNEDYYKKLNNKIFSKVDFISIAAYFELSDKKENTVKELVNALNSTTIYNRNQNVVEEIYRFYEKYNKPIYFAELGFPKKDNAATHPWNSEVSNVENTKEQSRCFNAYKIVFEDKDYIKGFSVFAVGKKGKDKNFYPSKESIEIISKWYY